MIEWDDYRWNSESEDKTKFMTFIGENYRLWSEDARFVLDQFMGAKASQLPSEIVKRADSQKIAYLGHSYGGLSAIYTTQRDARIKAAANLDGGAQDHMMQPISIDVPFLLLNSSGHDAAKFYTGSKLYTAEVAGASHMNFSDFVWLRERFPGKPFTTKVQKPLSGEEGLKVTRETLRLFLECSLQGTCDPLNRKLAELKTPRQ